jgi:hypothetical protein
MKIQFTNEATNNQGIKCLIYGRAKSGKTVLCSTAPNPFIFSAESGLLSLQWAKIPYYTISTIKDLYEAYKWVESSKEAKKYDTICLDSISEIAEVVLADEKKKTKDARRAYGETQDQILALIRKFRDMPGPNIYFSAKEERIVDGVTNMQTFSPLFPGQKLAQHVPYFFDEIFQLCVYQDNDTKKPLRTLRTRLHPQYVAGDRSGKLNEWEPPNLTTVFDKILN